MGRYDLDSDYKWFSDNQKELFVNYPNQYLIVSGGKILGAFDTFDKALSEALKEKKAGEFLIQQCVKNPEPIQYYNRAVVF